MDHNSVARLGKAALKLIGVNSTDSKADTSGDENLRFGLRSQMLSEPHALLYRALVAALAAEAVVFAKVRLTDFLYVAGGGEDLKHAIKMDQKFVDFLLCDPFSMQPLAVIEVSKQGDSTQTRDPFVSHALKTAEITLLKIESRSSYPIHELRSLLLKRIASQLKLADSQRTQKPRITEATRGRVNKGQSRNGQFQIEPRPSSPQIASA